MSVAVVFDSAGTLLRTYRVAKDVLRGELLRGVETTTLTFADPERALLILYIHSRDIMAAPPDMLLSEYIAAHNIGSRVACMSRVRPVEDLQKVLISDRNAHTGDLQECIGAVWELCRKEESMTMDSGAIIHTGRACIEYTVTSGGRPFRSARETIQKLHKMGVITYIASGDRDTKLARMAGYFGIPSDRVYGFATPYMKAQIVKNLQRHHEIVVMVGDAINDLQAMKQADVAILSLQQGGDKPEPLRKAADYVIRDLSSVTEIVARMTERDRHMSQNEK
ncbi:MAG: HAD family hydrolase [Methanoculleaceae archaeon]